MHGAGAVERAIGDGKTPVKFSGYRVSPGQFIYSRIDARNGAFAIIPQELAGAVVSKDFPIFDVRHDRISTEYLIHFFRSGKLQQLIRARSRGATNRQRVKEDEFLQFTIPLPSLEEQRRIAAILDHADALRAKRSRISEKLKKISEALFSQVSHSGDWPRRPLNELCLQTGEYGASVPSVERNEALPRYIRITDIDSEGNLNDDARSPGGDPDDWEKYRLQDGDVLFARSGATVGKTYLYREEDGDCVFAGYLIRFVPDPEKIDPDFLFCFTQTDEYRRWVVNRQNVVAQPNINAKQYGTELLVPVPPLSVQKEFAFKIAQLRELSRISNLGQEHLDLLSVTLQAQAFSGGL